MQKHQKGIKSRILSGGTTGKVLICHFLLRGATSGCAKRRIGNVIGGVPRHGQPSSWISHGNTESRSRAQGGGASPEHTVSSQHWTRKYRGEKCLPHPLLYLAWAHPGLCLLDPAWPGAPRCPIPLGAKCSHKALGLGASLGVNRHVYQIQRDLGLLRDKLLGEDGSVGTSQGGKPPEQPRIINTADQCHQEQRRLRTAPGAKIKHAVHPLTPFHHVAEDTEPTLPFLLRTHTLDCRKGQVRLGWRNSEGRGENPVYTW